MQITKQNSRRRIPKHFDGDQEKIMAPIDRLPDEILVHILSFMSTKRCVQSSILAKRWRFLWARVPNLDFNSGDHETVKSFTDFINRFVFIHKGQNIKTFRFYQQYDSSGDTMENEFEIEIEKLISTAIACNVQIIDILSDCELMLPQCIFTCKTLVDLKLYGLLENVPMTGTTVYLPALKKLKLTEVRFESEESIVQLLSGCPVLEELTIYRKESNVSCFHISSPTLTRLDLEIQIDYVEEEAFEVKLDTPALEYLKLHDSLSEKFSGGMLTSLTEADLYFTADTERVVLYSHSILEFVGKLNSVNHLKLITGRMEVPDSAFCALTTKFLILTKLELDADWRFVTFFLENSDNLEALTMVNLKYWMEPKQVPVCLISHLGKVRLCCFKCTEPEFNMVRYILRNAKVLKRMEISSHCYDHHGISIDWKKKFEALARISLFERASEACQLAFD